MFKCSETSESSAVINYISKLCISALLMVPHIPSHSTQVSRICINPINIPTDSHELLPNLVNLPYFRDKHLLQFNSHLEGSIRSCITESPKLKVRNTRVVGSTKLM
jgi:hypothetical protein